MDVLTLALFGLTVARLSCLLVEEDGPFSVFFRFRNFTERIHPELHELVSCRWCASVWIAAGLYIFYLFLPEPLMHFMFIMSFSMLGILISSWAVEPHE